MSRCLVGIISTLFNHDNGKTPTGFHETLHQCLGGRREAAVKRLLHSPFASLRYRCFCQNVDILYGYVDLQCETIILLSICSQR